MLAVERRSHFDSIGSSNADRKSMNACVCVFEEVIYEGRVVTSIATP